MSPLVTLSPIVCSLRRLRPKFRPRTTEVPYVGIQWKSRTIVDGSRDLLLHLVHCVVPDRGVVDRLYLPGRNVPRDVTLWTIKG